MKRILLYLLVFFSFYSFLYGQNKVESAKISFVFLSKDVEGSIAGFKSTTNFNPDNVAGSRFEGSVDVETLKTGNFLRDWSLKSGKYFDQDDYPRISFVSSSIEEEGENIRVRGKLKMKGTSNDISILFRRNGNELVGSTSLFTSDYGIEIKKKREDNLVEVTIKLELDN